MNNFCNVDTCFKNDGHGGEHSKGEPGAKTLEMMLTAVYSEAKLLVEQGSEVFVLTDYLKREDGNWNTVEIKFCIAEPHEAQGLPMCGGCGECALCGNFGLKDE